MILYFDTSAISKYFHTESGSAQVIRLIDDKANIIWLSELATTEFSSACHRKFRMGEINAKDLQLALTGFEAASAKWNIEALSALQAKEANRIIRNYGKAAGIRTLD
jgi:predicted nucleic acid-binding protein